MSEIELPSHWKVVKLGEFCDKPEYGYTASATEHDTGYKFLRITDIQNGKVQWESTPYCEINENKIDKYILHSGDIVVARIGATTGKSFLIENCPKSVFASYLIRVRTKHNLLIPEFLNFYFETESYWQQINANKGGKLKGGVNIPIIKSLRVSLPPLPEQKSIAHTLRTIQKAKETRQRELELEREHKTAFMQYLFTHGTCNELRKQTKIGDIPKSWDVVKLESLLREPLKNGHSAPASNSKEGIRTLILTAVTKNNFSIENTKLTLANADKVKNLWLKPGDIFIERANTYEMVGLAALYEGETNFAIYPDLMVRVRVKEETIFPKYLAEFLLAPMCRAYFKKNASGTAASMPKIDQGVIRRVNVLLPSYEEQKEIVEISRSCDRKISSLEKEITILDELFHAMLEQLMTGKISTKHLSEIHL